MREKTNFWNLAVVSTILFVCVFGPPYPVLSLPSIIWTSILLLLLGLIHAIVTLRLLQFALQCHSWSLTHRLMLDTSYCMSGTNSVCVQIFTNFHRIIPLISSSILQLSSISMSELSPIMSELIYLASAAILLTTLLL